MLDVDALERRWLTYKLKQLLPYVLYPLVAVVVGMGGIYLVKTIPFSKTVGTPTLAPKNRDKGVVTSSSPQAITPKTVDRTEAKTVLEPSMQFVQTLPIPSAEEEVKVSPPVQAPEKVAVVVKKENIAPKKEVTVVKKEVATVKKEVATVKKEVPVVEPKAKTLKATNKPPLIYPFAQTKQPSTLSPPPSLNGVSAVRTASATQYPATLDIHEMEDRFKDNNNPYVGLYIARYYYDHGNYNEAYNYALKTNALNSSMEESWLLVAKSLVKLGKTDQAKRALQVYIAQSNSERARNVLDSLEGGNR